MSTSASFSPASAPVAGPHIAPAANSLSPSKRRLGPGRWAAIVVGSLALAAAVYFGWEHLRFALAHEETDDAQVEGDISPVLPRVSGYVTRVLVRDNQRVAAGQPLLEVDARELDLKVASAQAALATARASVATSQATVQKSRAELLVAEASAAVASVREAKAAADLKRDTALFQTGAITDQQLRDSQAAADVARTEDAAAQRQVGAGRTDVAVAEAEVASAQAGVQARQSELDYARLQRSYATVTAPIAGIVSRKNVELGQYVQAGQTLLSIASETGVWIVANYKETQMEHIRVGEPVEVSIDAYPGVTFAGRVDSIAGATGARFALLPPDNASGNYIKVTQRIPVKIVLTAPDADRPLRAGMSADTAVLTRR